MQRIALIGAADGAVALSMPEAPGGVKARCLQGLAGCLNCWQGVFLGGFLQGNRCRGRWHDACGVRATDLS